MPATLRWQESLQYLCRPQVRRHSQRALRDEGWRGWLERAGKKKELRGLGTGIVSTCEKVIEVTYPRGQSSGHLWNFSSRFCGMFKPRHGHVVKRMEADTCDCFQSVTAPCNPRIWPYFVYPAIADQIHLSVLGIVPYFKLHSLPLFSGRTPKSRCCCFFFSLEIILPKKHKKKKGVKSLPEEDVAVSRNMFYRYD